MSISFDRIGVETGINAVQAVNVGYHSIITGEMPEDIVLKEKDCDLALDDNPDLKGWKVYLCGAAAMLKSLQ